MSLAAVKGVEGIHHVTAITRNVQANVDFYTGFLGLRLVKQSAGFEDAEQLHLFYGLGNGWPGSLITFLVWQNGNPGQAGAGQVSDISFNIPRASSGAWVQRCIEKQIAWEFNREFGESILTFRDPDGLRIKLSPVDGVDSDAPSPLGIGGVRILSTEADATRESLVSLGFKARSIDRGVLRLFAGESFVDVQDASGFIRGSQGTGIFDHVAFRVPDEQALRQRAATLPNHPALRDRKYFKSVYFREPAGTLFELATDGPGMTVDEPGQNLGQTLQIPPEFADQAQDIHVKLPKFFIATGGQMPNRELNFIHRFQEPEAPNGTCIVLLHGTGGSETDLMPMAAKISPRSSLMGVRGRSLDEGINRWFRRFSMFAYDQHQIKTEAAAFAKFMRDASSVYGIDLSKTLYLGYSNGANMLGAVMRLEPGLVHRAVLLRGIEALESPPRPNLNGAEVLVTTGSQDPYGEFAVPLITSLEECGATVFAVKVFGDHGLNARDLSETAQFVERTLHL